MAGEIITMVSRSTSKPAFLGRLMRMLVDEWGYAAVEDALAQISDTHRDKGSSVLQDRWAGISPSRAERRIKPSAVEQVSRLSIPDRERQSLLVLAKKFDQRSFLPKVIDIREFLAMRGEEHRGVKDRLDGFRVLLRWLSQLPSDKLEEIANSGRYSGPAQLGPLSDAIKSTGEAIRRQDGVPQPEKKS